MWTKIKNRIYWSVFLYRCPMWFHNHSTRILEWCYRPKMDLCCKYCCFNGKLLWILICHNNWGALYLYVHLWNHFSRKTYRWTKLRIWIHYSKMVRLLSTNRLIRLRNPCFYCRFLLLSDFKESKIVRDYKFSYPSFSFAIDSHHVPGVSKMVIFKREIYGF